MGVPSTQFLSPKGAILARKKYAVDLAHLKIDSLTLICGPPRSTRFSDMNVNVKLDYPGLVWRENSCWLDSSLHVLSVVFAHDPAAWISSIRNTWLYRMREYLQEYWETISSHQCGAVDFGNTVRRLQKSRDDLRRKMAAAPDAITFENREFGTPFVSVYYYLPFRSNLSYFVGLAIESTYPREGRKLGM